MYNTFVTQGIKVKIKPPFQGALKVGKGKFGSSFITIPKEFHKLQACKNSIDLSQYYVWSENKKFCVLLRGLNDKEELATGEHQKARPFHNQ